MRACVQSQISKSHFEYLSILILLHLFAICWCQKRFEMNTLHENRNLKLFAIGSVLTARELTNMSDDPQWRLTSPGCWRLSVQTWFCMTQVSTLTGKMSSGGSVWLTKVSDNFDTKYRQVSPPTNLFPYCITQGCIREICTWWRLWWAEVFLSPLSLEEDTRETSTNWPSDTPSSTEQRPGYGT